MLTKSTSHLAVLVLMTSFVGLPELVSAQTRDSSPQLIPGQERSEAESVRNEFLSRLRDHRSVEFRKESVSKEYAKLAKGLNELQQKNEKMESEFEALRSQYESATVIPRDIVHRISILDNQRDQLSRLIKSAGFQMNLLVEEYDVLSRLEDVERGYKAKAIPKVEYVSEERRLREELFQLRIVRQLDQLELRLTEGLSRIEMKIKL